LTFIDPIHQKQMLNHIADRTAVAHYNTSKICQNNLLYSRYPLQKVPPYKMGTCNPKVNRIWLNTELAKKPIESIEYVLIHEMVHLLERNHNVKFIAYMDKFLPKWKHIREELNRSWLGHVEWSY